MYFFHWSGLIFEHVSKFDSKFLSNMTTDLLNFDDIFINLRFVDEIKYPLLLWFLLCEKWVGLNSCSSIYGVNVYVLSEKWVGLNSCSSIYGVNVYVLCEKWVGLNSCSSIYGVNVYVLSERWVGLNSCSSIYDVNVYVLCERWGRLNSISSMHNVNVYVTTMGRHGPSVNGGVVSTPSISEI